MTNKAKTWAAPLLLLGAAMLAAPMLSSTVFAPARAADPTSALPSPKLDIAAAEQTGPQIAILSGGCFWGVQGVFEHVDGVTRVVAGYAGGSKDTANYETVSDGNTGHAESVQITFDPKQISYGQILRVFFTVALDPTQKNRQGPDSGTQYRSEIFYTSDAQKKVAAAYIAQLDGAHVFGKKIATRVDADPGFYAAEGYHQDYLVHHPDSGYIAVNDIPKVVNLKRLFPDIYRETPVLAVPNPS